MLAIHFSRRLAGLLALAVAMFSCSAANAQDSDRQRYEEALDEWRAAYVEALKVWSEFRVCEESEAEELRKQYLDVKKQGDALVHKTILAATDCLQNAITPDPELVAFLKRVPLGYYEESRYGDAVRVGKALIKHDPEDLQMIGNTARAAFFGNQFDYFGELCDKWIALQGSLPPELQPLFDVHEKLAADWKTEQQLREQEALKNELPRVAFELKDGSVIVELFEDQFPVVVNNLIWLIEQDEKPFFNDIPFFFVLKHQFSVTGSRTEDGSEVRPLTYATSEHRAKARQIFRGSVGLDIGKISGGAVVTTSCCFFQIPLPEMQDSTMVIGRVVEGMELIDSLQKTHELSDDFMPTKIEEAIPDRLVRVTVIRKPEGKEYKYIDVQAQLRQKAGDDPKPNQNLDDDPDNQPDNQPNDQN